MKRIPFVILLLSFLAFPAQGEDWPQFRGPTGQGHSTAKRVPLRWSDTENIEWNSPLDGLGWSSPAVQGDRIWLTTALEGGKSLRAICLDLATGKEIHNVEVLAKENPGRVHTKNSHASPTPVIEGDRVYVHFGTHGTGCLSTEGKIIWTKILKYNHVHGPGGSPVIFEDLLIINCDGGDTQFVYGLDKRTGEIRWKTPRAHIGEARLAGRANVPMGFSTPLLVEVGGVTQVVSTGADHVAGYDARTGKEIWWSSYDGYSLIPRPVVGHGLVFVCSGYNNPLLYAIRLGGKGDVTETHAEWSLKKGAPHSPSPILVGSELYVVSDGGVATCLDAKTGKEHWQKRLDGNFSASPIYAAGRLFFLDENGATTVLAPGTEYKELAKNQVTGRTLASLVPLEGGMLLRTDKHLLRIGMEK
jgi:outer membrane protein assembly factor BamB